jgi:hypothetical protein
MLKLYVVVRNDIDVPFQMCQVAHAVADFATAHPREFKDWNTGNNTICVLQTLNGDTLAKIVETAKDGNMVFTEFYEPDLESMGWESYDRVRKRPTYHGGGPWLTAVAFAPNWAVQNILLADLPLALDRDTVRAKHGFRPNDVPVRKERFDELLAESRHLGFLKRASRKQRRNYFKEYSEEGTN